MNYVAIVFALIYNLLIISGTAYLVAQHDWNPWWFLAAACFCVSTTDIRIIKDSE